MISCGAKIWVTSFKSHCRNPISPFPQRPAIHIMGKHPSTDYRSINLLSHKVIKDTQQIVEGVIDPLSDLRRKLKTTFRADFMV